MLHSLSELVCTWTFNVSRSLESVCVESYEFGMSWDAGFDLWPLTFKALIAGDWIKRGRCDASCCVLLDKCPNCNVNVNESFSISCYWHANCLVMLHSRLVHQRPDACSLTFAKFALGFVFCSRNVLQFGNCPRTLPGSCDSCDLMKENEEEETSISELEQQKL